jgi:hypothetical protein
MSRIGITDVTGPTKVVHDNEPDFDQSMKPIKIFEIRDQTLTFAVLSQTIGVVTCGKEMKPGPFSRIAFQKRVPQEFLRTKNEFYETYISTTSSSQKISSRFSQAHANRKRP